VEESVRRSTSIYAAHFNNVDLVLGEEAAQYQADGSANRHSTPVDSILVSQTALIAADALVKDKNPQKRFKIC